VTGKLKQRRRSGFFSGIIYLKLSDIRLGLLLNFNVAAMKEGIRRLVF